jgi:hypothetical protein
MVRPSDLIDAIGGRYYVLLNCELMHRADFDLGCTDEEDNEIASWDEAEDALDEARWYRRSMKALGVFVEPRVFLKDEKGRIYEVFYNDYGEVYYCPERCF